MGGGTRTSTAPPSDEYVSQPAAETEPEAETKADEDKDEDDAAARPCVTRERATDAAMRACKSSRARSPSVSAVDVT